MFIDYVISSLFDVFIYSVRRGFQSTRMKQRSPLFVHRAQRVESAMTRSPSRVIEFNYAGLSPDFQRSP